MRKKKNPETPKPLEPDYSSRAAATVESFRERAYYWSRARSTDTAETGFPGMYQPELFMALGALVSEVNELRERVESLESSPDGTPTSDPPRQ